jgi:serine protease
LWSSNFNEGESSGRYIYSRGFYETGWWWWWASIDGPDDQCGHGIQMAGLIAGSKGFNGSLVGAAYNSDLIALRVTSDVIINASTEKRGTADGLVFSANRSEVRIISMSIGNVFSSSRVADAVRYAYGSSNLIFAAAGTSLSWTSWYDVIFPANMSETVAITGVHDGREGRDCRETKKELRDSIDHSKSLLLFACGFWMSVEANTGIFICKGRGSFILPATKMDELIVKTCEHNFWRY